MCLSHSHFPVARTHATFVEFEAAYRTRAVLLQPRPDAFFVKAVATSKLDGQVTDMLLVQTDRAHIIAIADILEIQAALLEAVQHRFFGWWRASIGFLLRRLHGCAHASRIRE